MIYFILILSYIAIGTYKNTRLPKDILISIDQLTNVLSSPFLNFFIKSGTQFGNPDETLSSVFGKNIRSGNCKWCYYICRVLHLIDKDHCKKSIEEDENA